MLGKGKRAGAFFLSVAMSLAALSLQVPALAAEKKEGRIALTEEAKEINQEQHLYELKLSAALKAEESAAPLLLSFVLDGRPTMAQSDPSQAGKDAIARQTVVQAFRVLMNDANSQKENVYINLILFSGEEGKALSLTRWASEKEGQRGALETLNHSKDGAKAEDFVPLLLEEGGKTKLNPLLAQLLYCDYDSLDLLQEAAPGHLDKAYPLSNVYFYGNQMAAGTDGKNALGDAAEGSRFPLGAQSEDGLATALGLAAQDMDSQLKKLEASLGAEALKEAKKALLIISGTEQNAPEASNEWLAALQGDINEDFSINRSAEMPIGSKVLANRETRKGLAASVCLLSMTEKTALKAEEVKTVGDDAGLSAEHAAAFVTSVLPERVDSVAATIKGKIPEAYSFFEGADKQYFAKQEAGGEVEKADFTVDKNGNFIWKMSGIAPGTSAFLSYYVQLKPAFVDTAKEHSPLSEVKLSVQEDTMLAYANKVGKDFSVKLDDLVPLAMQKKASPVTKKISTEPVAATQSTAETIVEEELPEAVGIELSENPEVQLPTEQVAVPIAGEVPGQAPATASGLVPAPYTGENGKAALIIAGTLVAVSVFILLRKRMVEKERSY